MSVLKRLFDIFLSIILLIILIIPFIFIGIISVITQGIPVLLRQKRYGKNGKAFVIYKFRTMKQNAPQMATNSLSEEYITHWGRFLRKTSIDELPQIINILKGDMSFIGPRPLILEEQEIHKLRLENGIYSVRPGMTGWAQINGRDEVTLEEKVVLDKYYIDNQSIMLDIKIILKSFSAVLFGKGVRK